MREISVVEAQEMIKKSPVQLVASTMFGSKTTHHSTTKMIEKEKLVPFWNGVVSVECEHDEVFTTLALYHKEFTHIIAFPACGFAI